MLTILLLAFGLSTAEAKDLTGDEIRALFSGKTIHSYHERKDFDIVAFYAPDGTVRMERKGDTWTGKWRIDGNNICLQLNDPYSGVPRKERCRIIAEEDGVYKKYKVKDNGNRVHIITYRKFEDGNTAGL